MPSAALHPLESALERQTAAGLALLERAGPDAATRPAAGGWSVLECLDHLNKTAEASRALTAAALAGAAPLPEPRSSYRVRWWLRLMLREMEPPARLKTRTRAAFAPPEALEPGVVRAAFAARHEALSRQLHDLARYDLDRLRVRSPFAAYLRYSLYEWWLLLLAHERRHLWQAERALEALRDRAPGAIL